MADLTFISETGWFHSACRCTLGNTVEWYGFKPLKHLAPAGAGMVDRSTRSLLVNHSVSFDVNDTTLRSALQRTAYQFSSKMYVVGICDCVSFTAEVARQVGLRVPVINMTPYGFIRRLALGNTYKAKQ